MAHDYKTILERALELDAVDRAKLVEALALSLAEEAGLDPDKALDPETLRKETSDRLEKNLERSREVTDARIDEVLERARKRRG